ncbi:MAG: c-type cytochrome, partial [Planctomycetaceae bacterium]|nr:c-type cytochrome [Planctomycetaceae bacterium]
PDHTGPYFARTTWDSSESIAAAIRKYYENSGEDSDEFLKEQLVLHRVQVEGLPEWSNAEAEAMAENKPIAIPSFDPNNPDQIGNLQIEEVLKRLAAVPEVKKVNQGKKMFISQACNACHTIEEGQTPKGPHLVDIGKRYKREELIDSILKPSAKIAQGFDTYQFVMADGKQHIGFVSQESAESIIIRRNDGVAVELLQDDIEFRKKQETSMMPVGLVNNLTVEQFAELLAYLESLKSKKNNKKNE